MPNENGAKMKPGVILYGAVTAALFAPRVTRFEGASGSIDMPLKDTSGSEGVCRDGRHA